MGLKPCRLVWQSFNNKQFFIFTLTVLVLVSCADQGSNKPLDELPVQTAFKVEDFKPAEQCKNCHPNHYAEWSASMHAYSMQDPVWMKMQSHEQSVQKAHGVALGDFCVQCHSPIASLTNSITDHENFSTAELSALPEQIQEGVTCDVCHLVTHLPEPTDIQTANQQFETVDFKMYSANTRYGILSDPMENEFHSSVYHSGYDKSAFCQNCHNLTVNSVDAEVTNFEWQGSAFEAMGAECQTCHMPTYTGQAAENGPVRENVHKHFFPGIDTQLNSATPNADLVSAIDELLLGAAAVNWFEPLPDTLTAGSNVDMELIVSNNTGHHFPSGTTFIRQLWLELIAVIDGDTIFSSGLLNAFGDIADFYIDPAKTADPQLKVFNTVLYNSDGDSGLFNVGVENMVSMSDYTLPVSGSRKVGYILNLPENKTGVLNITARLRFRSFPPFLLRYFGLQTEANLLPVFEIDELSTSITIQ